jgi:hypothetical protein
MVKIETREDFDRYLSAGPWAWPGGYPLFFIMSDLEALSFGAAIENADRIREAIDAKDTDRWNDWNVIGVDVNWEDPLLFCCHKTTHRIPSAYAEDKEDAR